MVKISRLLKNRRIIFYSSLIALNGLIFLTTDPLTSPILLVVAGYVLATLNLVALTYLGLVMVETILQRRLAKRRLLIGLGSFEAVMLALTSIGQLTWWDWVVVLAIWLIAYWYGNRFYPQPPRSSA